MNHLVNQLQLKKYVLFFTGGMFLFFYACKDGNADFKNYYTQLPLVKLPLTIKCGLCGSDSLVSDSLIKKYAFKGARVIGRIADDKRVYIIYNYPGDICYPYLYTYNQDGKILDSLYLHINTCTEDEYLGYSTWSVIHQDKSISMIDTEKYFTEDTATQKRFLIAKVIRKRDYQINSRGIPKLSASTKDSIACHTLAP